ncbi:MAG: hypothetical protein QM783_02330 [Phycisphaerales bacterium]
MKRTDASRRSRGRRTPRWGVWAIVCGALCLTGLVVSVIVADEWKNPQPLRVSWLASAWYGDPEARMQTQIDASFNVERSRFLGVCIGTRATLVLTETQVPQFPKGRRHIGSEPANAQPPTTRDDGWLKLRQHFAAKNYTMGSVEVQSLLDGVWANADRTATIEYPWRGAFAPVVYASPAMLVAGGLGMCWCVWRWRVLEKNIARGCCARCEYPLGKQGVAECPECGLKAEPSAAHV